MTLPGRMGLERRIGQSVIALAFFLIPCGAPAAEPAPGSFPEHLLRFTAVTRTSGGITVSWEVRTLSRYQLEASDNLELWRVLKKGIDRNGEFIDPIAPGVEARYYRAVLQKSPPVILTNANPKDLQQDRFTLEAITLTRNFLDIEISYSGGCKDHAFQLFMSPPSFLESFPVQANLWLQHQAHGDSCKALIRKTVDFDLTPVVELHQLQNGFMAPLVINVFRFFDQTPEEKLQLTLTPGPQPASAAIASRSK